jgi:predicted phage terminase large subunit-like protein
MKPLSKSEWNKLKSSRIARQKATIQSFYWFFHLYFEQYIKYETADFQKEIISTVSDPNILQMGVMAFRGSAKSSILTTAYPLWAIVSGQKKFIVIVSLNQALANAHLRNIVHALNESALLKADHWPYDFEENETNQSVIRFPKFGAQIIAVGREQGMRGVRRGNNRPDSIIVDDVEDTANTRYQHSRDANFKWYTSELMTLGDEETKYITIGNMVHPDSIIGRLKRDMQANVRDGVFLEYPLIKDGEPLWKSRFPDEASIETLKKRIGDPVIFQREYMLNYVADGNSILTRDDIEPYDKIPPLPRGERERIIIGVDPAISSSSTADLTAMTIITVRGYGEDTLYYVHPNPVHKRLDITQIHKKLDELNRLYNNPKFYIETNAFQLSVFQAAQQRGLDVTAFQATERKDDRLNMIAYRVKSKMILFPKTGAEELITQLVDYPAIAHDDLMDSLTTAIISFSTSEVSQAPGTVSGSGRRRTSRRREISGKLPNSSNRHDSGW